MTYPPPGHRKILLAILLLAAFLAGCVQLARASTKPPPGPLAASNNGQGHHHHPHPSPSPTSTSPSPSPTGMPCIVTDTYAVNPGNQCTFPAAAYPQNQGATVTRMGNDMWNPVPGSSLTMTAYSPGYWTDVVSIPAHSGVVAYPSEDADFHVQDAAGNWVGQPVSGFTTITSSFSENMHATAGTIASAAYDLLFDNGGQLNEVMIHHGLAQRGGCGTAWTAQNVTFGGSNGVPLRSDWDLCVSGTAAFWQVPAADSFTSGAVDVKAMLQWLVDHGYLAPAALLGDFGYGFEVESTNGVPETFQVSNFSITVTR